MNQFPYNNYSFQPQPIQNMAQQSQAMCFFVKTANDLVRSDIMPNVFYVGRYIESDTPHITLVNACGNREVANG